MSAGNSDVNQVSLSSFNSNHELYDKVRPDFPAAAVDGLVSDMMRLTPGKSRILEVASGTGKFTRALVNRGYCGDDTSNSLLVAVEPSQGMIDSFQKNFPNNWPPVVKASAYDMSPDIASTSFDAVIAAQAFHWFGNAKALKEFARVLVDGGKLGLVWNYEDLDKLPATNWQVKVTEYIWSFDGDVPQYRRLEWVNAFAPNSETGEQFFQMPYEEKVVEFELVMARDQVWPYWASRSYITALPESKQLEIKQNVEKIVYADDIPASDIAENGKDLIVRRATHVVCATKI